ncbi:MAG: hypothetical protein CFE21_05170 [Bacteroidetes bacterium B1(2017)]|nr:MAG: hypothetical protein CFE21_05170 [Bacteroidetes bacterium B1(2017)]
MGHLLFILTLLLPINPSKELIEMRDHFHHAIKDEKAANSLESSLSQISEKTSTQQGYEGANKMILAKYATLPTRKYSLYVNGKTLLETAISKDPENIELIYLRFIIQTNSPSFLGYNQNLGSDRAFLLEHTKALTDKDLKTRISTFLVIEGKLSEAERKKLQ